MTPTKLLFCVRKKDPKLCGDLLLLTCSEPQFKKSNNIPFLRIAKFEFSRYFSTFQVLCEIEYALLQKGVPEEDLAEIPREIIPDRIRNLEDQSYRNLRDWYIYRDYMNGLEYVVDAFNHLRHKNTSKRRRRRRRQTFNW